MNHSLLAVAVFGAIVAFAAGYDFKDEIYNQMIKQDIDEIQTSFFFDDDQFVNVRRRKREDDAAKPASTEKCKKRRWPMCCGEEIIDVLIEKEKDVKKECFKEVMALTKDDKPAVGDPFSCEKITKVKKEWACVMQCVGQKKNVVDEEGNIKEKELLEHYKNELGSEEWFYSLMEAAYPKCLEQAKGAAADFTKDEEDPLSCNPVSIKMHHCMWRELQLACPDDKITDKKTCSKIREKINKNDYLSFKHHHHDDD